MDYEQAARNSMKSVFTGMTLKDDYFHLCNCLWKNAKKHHICSESVLPDTLFLVGFLKMLIHMELETRKEIFKEIKFYFQRC